MPVSTTRRAIVRLPAGAEPSPGPDDLAVEDPLVLGLDGDAIATLMRTPGHDLELTAGWLGEIVLADGPAPRPWFVLRSGVGPTRPPAAAFCEFLRGSAA